MPLPLQGLTVVAIEQAVAAPFATSRLADAGARVIKIERKEGDFARGYDSAVKGQSSYFVWLNRGKESVVLDIASEEGKAALAGLLDGADVLVQNLKPGALARLGFDDARLARDWPRLISLSISGYGEEGPMADRKAYDLLIQAESGLCSITGGPESAARVGISVVDIATGATAYAAILEALIQRGTVPSGVIRRSPPCPGATETEATAGMQGLTNLQPAADVARLALDNLREGPTFVPHDHYRGMFDHLRSLPRREALAAMAQGMKPKPNSTDA